MAKPVRSALCSARLTGRPYATILARLEPDQVRFAAIADPSPAAAAFAQSVDVPYFADVEPMFDAAFPIREKQDQRV